ncbi:MAG: hypothetical protein Q8Q41_02015 [bacterium]|nr:hypothetical protein [bacterium]
MGGYLVILAVVAVYLNIGWAVGTYYFTYIIDGKRPRTFWQQVWAGWGGFMASPATIQLKPVDQIFPMIVWPIIPVGFALGSWAVYGLYRLVWLIWWGLYWLFWLIFAGGIAKLLDVG